MSFDILNVQLSPTTSFQLQHPINGPMFADEAQTQPITFEVYGRSSKVFRDYMATQARKNAAKEKSGKANKVPTAEEVAESNAEFYATITKSITNLNIGGEEVNNFDMYKKLYANPALDWVTAQVGEAFGDLDGFFQQ